MAARKPKGSPDADERLEVTLAVSRGDLAVIDAAARNAGLSRELYIVGVSKQSALGLYDAVQHLQAELARFLADGHAWKLEIERLQQRIESMQRDRNQAREVLVAMLATVTDAGAAQTVINALSVAIRALDT